MREYYASRAQEYDAIYHKPERQADLQALRRELPQRFVDTHLLEVACGTGYWTQWLAGQCRTIVAQDINMEVLQVASQRLSGAQNATLVCEDAFALASLARRFNAAFAGFWYSHLRMDQVRSFLELLHTRLLPNSLVVLLDNRYVEGSSTPICRRDNAGNSWQMRTIAQTGERYEVLKNFPDQQQFTRLLPPGVHCVEFVEMQYYWYACYRLGE